MSIAPAFSPGPTSTPDPSFGSRPSSGRECLYAQCSDHIAPNMPSSTSFGMRPRASTASAYSSTVSPWSRSTGGGARVMWSSARGSEWLVAADLEEDRPDHRPGRAEEEEQFADAGSAGAEPVEGDAEADERDGEGGKAQVLEARHDVGEECCDRDADEGDKE